MTAVAAAGRRFLPRGWADLGRQLVIWFGFALVYQVARGVADRSPATAFGNAREVIDFERRAWLEDVLKNDDLGAYLERRAPDMQL